MRQRKDTDYLALTSRIKAMENSLLSRERLEEMIQAKSDEEVAKVLEECGYPRLSAQRPEEMDQALTAAREAMMADLGDCAPDRRFTDIFRVKYDYHNLKALLKAQAMDTDPARVLVSLGRVPAEIMRQAVYGGEEELPPRLEEALAEAREVLQTTGDPQLSDIVLDRRCYEEMLALAEETGSDFLTGYVRVMIDAVNLRALVRTLRMGKSPEFLDTVLLEGGTISTDTVRSLAAARGSGMGEVYGPTALAEAAEAGAAALNGGALTAFEKRCDDAVSGYLDKAKYVAFGEEPLVGYLAAQETELTNLRIVFMGRAAGLEPDVIRERLREAYV